MATDGSSSDPPVELNANWTMWFDNPRLSDPEKEWKDNLTNCGSFDTIEKFWRIFNNLKPASQLPVNSNYHVFREGVIPMWEDPANKEGGKFVLTMPKKDSRTGRCDEWWLYTVLAIIGETLDMDGDEVCGAVVSIRKNQDRIALWLKSNDQSRCTLIGARWKKCLEMNRTILKFQEHKAAAASGRSFRNESTFEVQNGCCAVFGRPGQLQFQTRANDSQKQGAEENAQNRISQERTTRQNDIHAIPASPHAITFNALWTWPDSCD